MLRIIKHIERLLLTHDCVILPKFGGFVLQTLPATYQEEEHLFRSMRKEVMFNVTLQHTDGLLSESYMQTYGVDYRKAQLMLEEDIEALNVSLEQDKRITLGRIGTFSIGEEGQTIFLRRAILGYLNADSYGLSSFHFPVLRSLEEEREEVTLLTGKKKKDVFYIPVSRKLIRVVAASAAAVALFFVVSTPVKEVNLSAYTASFVPTEMINYRFEEPISQPEEIQISQVDEMVAEVTPKIEATKETEIAKAASAPEVKKELVAPAPKVKSVAPKKMYHIVIASFPTEEQANEYISGVDRAQCKNVSKVVRDGKYRIYADKFNNRADAESYMATLRKIEKYKDAWLFISR
ncbi:MAG: SPOR domain-containing protein [Phocaeicola vulgatus]|nr:MAG: SPOR domain-containing protein [Phocaeicola vulgatus]